MSIPSPLLSGHDNDSFPAWDGSAIETKGLAVLYIEVQSYGGSPITITGGLLADNPVAVIDMATTSIAATITAPGFYQVPACGRMKASGIGSSVVNVLLKVG